MGCSDEEVGRVVAVIVEEVVLRAVETLVEDQKLEDGLLSRLKVLKVLGCLTACQLGLLDLKMD